MLDPKSVVDVGPQEEDEPNRENKRIAIMVNGLCGAQRRSIRRKARRVCAMRSSQLEGSQEPASVRLEAVAVAKEMDADAAASSHPR